MSLGQISGAQAVKETGLFVNLYKTEFMCFKQGGAISILNGNPLI